MASVVLAVVIHFAREAPVWQLIAKASIVGGSTGYHRYALVNAFILRWSEWFLVGTASTAHWGYFLFDLANQYVKEGVVGGIATVTAFLSAIALALQAAWRMSTTRRISARDRKMAWGIVASLCAFAVMFIGISITHSNQVTLTFLLLLSAASAAGEPKPAPRRSHRAAH